MEHQNEVLKGIDKSSWQKWGYLSTTTRTFQKQQHDTKHNCDREGDKHHKNRRKVNSDIQFGINRRGRTVVHHNDLNIDNKQHTHGWAVTMQRQRRNGGPVSRRYTAVFIYASKWI